MSNTPLLQAETLTQIYAGSRSLFGPRVPALPAVDRVSLALYAGETLGLVGESGSGKSSLCRLLLKLEEPASGSLLFRGQRIASGVAPEFRRNVQAVFQNPAGSLHPRMRIGQILAEPLDIFHPELSRHERQERVAQAMRQVGLDPALSIRYPGQFSGGQLQRVCIARALMLKPAILIADEPITALDVSIQAQIVNLLKDLQQELHLACLFVSHDLNMVRYLCHRVAVLYRGRIVEIASTEALFTSPRHPYTQSLLAATPVPDPDAPLRAIIPYSEAMLPTSAALIEVAPGHLVLQEKG